MPGIAYEVVKHPPFPRGRRTELEAKTGQRALPAIEFEDGTTLREESKDLAAQNPRRAADSPSVGGSAAASGRCRACRGRARGEPVAQLRHEAGVDRVGMRGVSR